MQFCAPSIPAELYITKTHTIALPNAYHINTNIIIIVLFQAVL